MDIVRLPVSLVYALALLFSGCSEDEVLRPQEYLTGVTGTWIGELDGRSLEIQLVQWSSGSITGTVMLDSIASFPLLEDARAVGDTLLIPFACPGGCQRYLLGVLETPDRVAGEYSFWEINPRVGEEPPVGYWFARRVTKHRRSPLSVSNVTGAGENRGHYPLDAGWEWKYLRTFTIFTIDGDVDYQSSDTSWVEATGVADLDGMAASVLSIRSVGDDGRLYEGMSYYTQDRKSLIQLDAVGNSPIVYPSPRGSDESPARFRLVEREFHSAEELDDFFRAKGPLGTGLHVPSEVSLRDEPRIVLSYPLYPRKSWVAFSSPWIQTRTVAGREAVVVPAGRWAATRIDIEVGVIPDLSFADWFGPPGLVRRRIEARMDGGTVFQSDTLLVVENIELLSYARGHPRDRND